jgi:uncharacterized protein
VRALLDVNVLIALHDPQHVHHELAVDWFVMHAELGWASCPLTQNGMLRIMSQAAYPNAQRMPDLMRLLERSLNAPQHDFWADDISLVDAQRFDRAQISGHRQLTDLYLLALAVKRRGRFVTFDARIVPRAVHGAEPRNLVALLA